MIADLVDRARALAPQLVGHRASHDAQRRLAPEVVSALREHGMFGALVPAELGGHELAPRAYATMLEALAAGDSATAWCVMTASTSTLLAPYLSRELAATLWAPGKPAPFLAGIFAPTGTLERAGDHATLSGRWSWASGSRHADMFVVGALAERRHVVCVVPPTAVGIVDNWDTLGLAGTGSHDLVIADATLPLSHVTSVFDRAPWCTAPLYRVPLFGMLAVGIAGCALGMATAALDHATRSLTAETSSSAWTTVGELRAQLDAARAYLHATADAAHAAAIANAVTPAVRGGLRLAACHVATTCAQVGRGAFHLGGGASVRTGSPLGSALRDLETVLTHRMVAAKVVPAATRALHGVGNVPPDL